MDGMVPYLFSQDCKKKSEALIIFLAEYKAIEWISLNDITVQKSSSVTIAWFFLLYSILDYRSSA